MTYTYILKDKKLDIFKIGRSADPNLRFRSLCEQGRIVPIALVPRDIEQAMHKEFKDVRVTHSEFKGNGGTEWFRRGGKFKKMLKKVGERELPFITVHRFMEELLIGNYMLISEMGTRWELANSVYGYYKIGLKLLYLAGYIRFDTQGLPVVKEGKEKSGVSIIRGKVALSEELVKTLKKDYKYYVSPFYNKEYILENRKDIKASRVAKIPLDKDFSEGGVFLLLNKVL